MYICFCGSGNVNADWTLGQAMLDCKRCKYHMSRRMDLESFMDLVA